ncbi:hypothetical protein BpHYR1_029517 [Brachionus plicatilis]|uniref:Uncharacterized protein n=1 Tax=Brachionus plicatilis TaxID=10195 RepID=A0A3M7P6D4_BRAPC|nr:hypothetical protein BpHYR1_029517 [Brachionus plicatilis]
MSKPFLLQNYSIKINITLPKLNLNSLLNSYLRYLFFFDSYNSRNNLALLDKIIYFNIEIQRT